MSQIDFPEQTSEQAAMFQRVRRMMLIASITTAVAISAVLVAVGYRLFTSGGSAQTNDVTAMLPKGAKIYATAVAGDKLVIMLDVGGTTQIPTLEAPTNKPAGN